MPEDSVGLSSQTMKAACTSLSTAQPTPRSTLAVMEQAAAATSAAKPAGTAATGARVTDPCTAAATTAASAAEPAANLAHQIAKVGMTTLDLAAWLAAQRLPRRQSRGWPGGLTLARRRYG